MRARQAVYGKLHHALLAELLRQVSVDDDASAPGESDAGAGLEAGVRAHQ